MIRHCPPMMNRQFIIAPLPHTLRRDILHIPYLVVSSFSFTLFPSLTYFFFFYSSISLFLCLSFSLYLCLYVSLSLYLYLTLSFSLFFFLSFLPLFFFLSFSFSLLLIYFFSLISFYLFTVFLSLFHFLFLKLIFLSSFPQHSFFNSPSLFLSLLILFFLSIFILFLSYLILLSISFSTPNMGINFRMGQDDQFKGLCIVMIILTLCTLLRISPSSPTPLSFYFHRIQNSVQKQLVPYVHIFFVNPKFINIFFY